MLFPDFWLRSKVHFFQCATPAGLFFLQAPHAIYAGHQATKPCGPPPWSCDQYPGKNPKETDSVKMQTLTAPDFSQKNPELTRPDRRAVFLSQIHACVFQAPIFLFQVQFFGFFSR